MGHTNRPDLLPVGRQVLPDGSEESPTLHVINGAADEITAQLLERRNTFFEIHPGI